LATATDAASHALNYGGLYSYTSSDYAGLMSDRRITLRY